jgi:hypothetical protein
MEVWKNRYKLVTKLVTITDISVSMVESMVEKTICNTNYSTPSTLFFSQKP